MMKTVALLLSLALATACVTTPITLPPEGTTATITSESTSTTRRPLGPVTKIRETSVRSSLRVTNTPPRYRSGGPYRGEVVMGCNRVGDVWQYLDMEYAPSNVCRLMEATDAQPRSSYRAADGHCYTIMEFGVGFSRYFTSVPSGYCQITRWY